MPDLHEAVARAIDQAYRDYFGNALWTHDAAAAAVRVVLAEAARSIEDLVNPDALDCGDAYNVNLGEALAVLAALGDDA